MYSHFYGFSESPFNVAPDPRFLYLTPSHREALASMMYGITERKGFILITGEVGTGKTTLIHTLLKKLNHQVKTVFIFHTLVTFEELLKTVLWELDVPIADGGKSTLLHALSKNLIQRFSQHENVVLIIDEAQDLAMDVLEEFRLLLNFNMQKVKLVQIVLVGQPELETKLNSPELRPLKQQIEIRRRIDPLRAEESKNYIDHRLRLTGSSSSEIFTQEAVTLISAYGKGIPRRINTICDNALLIGYALSKKKIDADIVREVLNDMREVSLPPTEDDMCRPAESRTKDVPNKQGFSFMNSFLIELIEDIQNTHASIYRATSLALKKVEDTEMQRESHTRIRGEIKRLDFVLNNVLNFIRVNTPIAKTNTLYRILEEILETNERQLREKNLKIIKRGEKDIPETYVHDEQVRFILNSILQYAALLTPPNESIVFLTKSLDFRADGDAKITSPENKGGYVEVVIGFNGARKSGNQLENLKEGIPAAQREATDLILQLAKEVLRKHSGTMIIKSNGKRLKSLIILRLPVERRNVVYYAPITL